MSRGRAAFLIALAANVAIAVGVRYFPFEDATNHLARYVLLERAWWGPGTSFIATHPVPGPYVAPNVIGALLVHALGPAWAMRVVAALTVSAIPLGFYYLLTAVGSDAAAWAVAGVPIGFGFFVHAGFINYVMGVGTALAFLGFWWPARARPGAGRVVALIAGVALCYLTHLSAVLMVLTVVWIDALLARDRRVVVALLLSAAAVGMLVWTKRAAPPAPASDTVITMGSVWWKTRNIFAPFYVYSVPQAALMFAVYALAVGLFVRANAPLVWRSTWGAAIGAFALLYVTFPVMGTGGGYLDMRWLVPAYLLVFCLAAAAKAPTTRGLAALVGGSLLSTAVLFVTIVRINRVLGDYAAVLAALPPGRTVFPIVADDRSFGGRVIPYRHFAFWYEIERGGRVPALFNYGGDGGGAEVNWFMPYFNEPSHLYAPPIGWFGGGIVQLGPLDWPRIAREYDYVVVAGTDPAMRADVAAHARPLSHLGNVAVYDPRLY